MFGQNLTIHNTHPNHGLLVTIDLGLPILPGVINAPYPVVLLVKAHMEDEYFLVAPDNLKDHP